MQLKKLNKVVLTTLFIGSYSFANSSFESSILSKNKEETFILQKKQIEEEANKLRKDWINPISIQYKKNLGESNKIESSMISINQPIFQSGGIYEAIKYANSTKSYSLLNLQEQKQNLIKEAYSLLFSIHKLDLNIQKTKYLVTNAKIDLQRKKEQVLNGFLDSSFLDNALLTFNSNKVSLVELKFQKKQLENTFINLTSKNYSEFKLPNFKIISQEEFINKNLSLKKADVAVVQKDNFAYMTKTRFLPTVNIFYNLSKNHYTDGNSNIDKNTNQTYGLSINLSLDSRALNEIQSKKIEYLRAKLDLINQKNDEITFFKNQINTLNLIEEKIKINKEDLKIYDSILTDIKEEKEAELKTQSDLDTLQNSQKIKELDLKVLYLEKQNSLLELYSKLY